MWVLTKLLTKTIPHTFVRNGYYYFSRRVPSDLRDHYSYHRIVQGLRTTSPQKAKVQASITSAKLEAYWNQVRLAKSDVIGMSLVRDTSISSLKVDTKQSQSDCPSLLCAGRACCRDTCRCGTYPSGGRDQSTSSPPRLRYDRVAACNERLFCDEKGDTACVRNAWPRLTPKCSNGNHGW